MTKNIELLHTEYDSAWPPHVFINRKKFITWLNERHSNGWGLVCYTENNGYIFKRIKQQ
jgi:predicted glutamine amidotransferase